jgi:hypothetical protein
VDPVVRPVLVGDRRLRNDALKGRLGSVLPLLLGTCRPSYGLLPSIPLALNT